MLLTGQSFGQRMRIMRRIVLLWLKLIRMSKRKRDQLYSNRYGVTGRESASD